MENPMSEEEVKEPQEPQEHQEPQGFQEGLGIPSSNSNLESMFSNTMFQENVPFGIDNDMNFHFYCVCKKTNKILVIIEFTHI